MWFTTFANPQRAEMPLAVVRVVRAAPELEISSGRGTPVRVGHDVMKLQKPTFLAAAVVPHEGATSIVALPHFPLHGSWDVARPCGYVSSTPRTCCRGEFPFL
jgi:hypothetical protein